jgi:hypothetical protein
VRDVSVSKVSRQARELIQEMGLQLQETRGMPDPELLNSGGFIALRSAYQQWRLDLGCLKVFPTFAASVATQGFGSSVDVLPDVYLSADQIADHLLMRRFDLVISASLDLAGELIQQAQSDPSSPFVVIPLFQDPVSLALNPAHPLAGVSSASAEDCRVFPSAAYPEGNARMGAAALQARGLWKFPAKRNSYDPKEWFLGMRSPVGLSYNTLFLSRLIPEVSELIVIPFC